MASNGHPVVITTANQKGGVAKTTTAVNLAALIAEQGKRVICAGLDTDFRGVPFGPIPDLMARAELVLKAVELLVDQENLAAETRVVESLAELWIDYTLLAEAANEDSLFRDLDVEPLVLQQVAQSMVFQLRSSGPRVPDPEDRTLRVCRYGSSHPARRPMPTCRCRRCRWAPSR